ncbi:MAG: NADPH-dependent 7-cyano-7-deazaguanine reductase QueF [Deltaproteobacteria bacterium]|nr:NADPH-dependent 7-cyano-7-deazaguanine reductase QueF [Deltaproteobacteria bacterium]
MPKAEGRIVEWVSEEAIRTDWLETLPYSGDPQVVTYETDEFSAVCPFSGLPDLGRLTIQYVPDKALVELKSLKYYVVSFRQVGIYQENATDRIYRDLWEFLRPKYLKVVLEYKPRGGFIARCEKASASPETLKEILYSAPGD